MENASKALLMAGSMLVSVLVIALFTTMYGRLSDVEQAKDDTEETKRLTELTQEINQYGDIIYGVDLLSLCNTQQQFLNDGTPVTIEVNFLKDVKEDNTYIASGKRKAEQILQGVSNLENDIKFYEDTSDPAAGYRDEKSSIKKSVKYYAQLSVRQIADLFELNEEYPYDSSTPDIEIRENLEKFGGTHGTQSLMKDIEKYNNLKTLYTEFKRKRFERNTIKYTSAGIVSKMTFTEILDH